MSDIESRVDDIYMRWRSMRPEEIDAEEIKKNIQRTLDEMPDGVRVFSQDMLLGLRLMGGDMRKVSYREYADCLLELIDEGRVRVVYYGLLGDPPSYELVEKKSVK